MKIFFLLLVKQAWVLKNILEAIIERIPAPKGDPNAPLQALIFDSVFNSFRGIIAYFRITNGNLKKGEKVKFVNTGMNIMPMKLVF